MKNCFIAALLALSLSASFAEPTNEALPHVAIAGFSNNTGDASFDTPSATATESLALTIRRLGAYEILAPDSIPSSATDAELLAWCQSNSVDFVLYGSVAAAKGGAQAYDLAVFDRAKGKTTIRKSAKGTSVFDVFSCADDLTFAVIDAIAGRHVGFGSIAFEVANPGKAEGKATISLDGAVSAEGFAQIDRVVEGRHLVGVAWEAPGAKPKEIALVEIEVAEGKSSSLAVTVPVPNAASATAKAPSADNANMVFVEGGTFTMGSDTGPLNERPAHEVAVKSFWMGKTEVTQGDFNEAMKYLPNAAQNGFTQKKYGSNYPVLLLEWVQALEYCNAASIREGYKPAYSIKLKNSSYVTFKNYDITWDRLADGYRLPTEEEWEYAAKGGLNHDAFIYPGSDDAREVAVTANTSGGNGFEIVASRKPNTLGIFDLGGNVGEWCWNIYGPYSKAEKKRLSEKKADKARVLRGGDSIHKNDEARCTARSYAVPELKNDLNNGFVDMSRNIGFRVVRSVVEGEE